MTKNRRFFFIALFFVVLNCWTNIKIDKNNCSNNCFNYNKETPIIENSNIALKSDTIKVGVFDDLHPFQFRNNKGDLDGLNIEIIKTIAHHLHKKIRFEVTTSEESYQKLLQNKLDIALNLCSTDTIRKDSNILITVQTANTTRENYRPRHNKILQFILGSKKIEEDSFYYLGARKDNKDLIKQLNNTIYHLKIDGTFDQITYKWNVVFHKKETKRNLILIIIIIYVLIFGFMWLLFFFYRKHLSHKKTHNEQMKIFSTLLDKISLPIYIKNICNPEQEFYRNKTCINLFGDLECHNSNNYCKKLAETELNQKEHTALINKIRTRQYEFVKDKNNNDLHTILIRNLIEVGHKRYIMSVRNIINEVVEARQKAENARNLKIKFLANMGHEIRTPLNAIIGFSEILGETEDKEEMKNFIKIIEKNSDLLTALIDDIIKLSSYQTSNIPIKPEWINIDEFMQNIYLTYKNQLKTKGKKDIELIFENSKAKDLQLYIDQRMLMQIMTNYLNNAVKYTLVGRIRFGLHYYNNKIEFFVEDTGIGIPEDKIHQVFTRFEKLDNVADGHGLGMAICKSIADSMNAKVGVYSEEGIGSTFYFTIDAPIKKE